MHGATINGKHTYWDWGLLPAAFPAVSPPEPKTKVIEIPGTDHVIDLTETLSGKVNYEQREITYPLLMTCSRDRWEGLYTEILNHLHGKKVEIILDVDNEYYYTGRAEISDWKPGKAFAEITIKATVNPYKTARFIKGKKVL